MQICKSISTYHSLKAENNNNLICKWAWNQQMLVWKTYEEAASKPAAVSHFTEYSVMQNMQMNHDRHK